MKYDVITIGSAVRDTYLFLDKLDALIIDNPKRELTRKKLIALEYGAKIDAKASAQAVGGGGINSAVTFSRLGLKTAAAVSIGEDDNAGAIHSVCMAEGVSTKFVQINSKEKTGFSTLIVAGAQKDRVAIIERGANSSLILPKHGISNTEWIYLTSLSGKNWMAVLKNIFQIAKNNGIKLAWNPGAEQLEPGLRAIGKYLKQCSVLLLNRDEALGLLSSRRSKRIKDKPQELLLSLLGFGGESVVITDGVRGAYYADRFKMLHISANQSICAKERTGAGDSFGSGFVAGLIKNKDVEYALNLGISNSESVIQEIGPQAGILHKRDLKKVDKNNKHKIKKINKN